MPDLVLNPEFDWLSADNLDGVEYGATILNTIHFIEQTLKIKFYSANGLMYIYRIVL